MTKSIDDKVSGDKDKIKRLKRIIDPILAFTAGAFLIFTAETYISHRPKEQKRVQYVETKEVEGGFIHPGNRKFYDLIIGEEGVPSIRERKSYTG